MGGARVSACDRPGAYHSAYASSAVDNMLRSGWSPGVPAERPNKPLLTLARRVAKPDQLTQPLSCLKTLRTPAPGQYGRLSWHSCPETSHQFRLIQSGLLHLRPKFGQHRAREAQAPPKW